MTASTKADGTPVVTAKPVCALCWLVPEPGAAPPILAGIPPEKLERIFDRFYRGDETSSVQGFCLGLPFAKSLVERQAGSINMESELGKGSMLIIRFPPLSKKVSELDPQ